MRSEVIIIVGVKLERINMRYDFFFYSFSIILSNCVYDTHKSGIRLVITI